ncbi:hypothetical protein [uncultured Friedmanniella sp.]|uniref:hypothetical protein n=1 Tax=uncultured Friedmanniella sp. TaxID=335381 RepID=UPI0035CC2291
MATWQDGPEYAPLVRPDEFAEPAVQPLEIAPPVPQPAAGAPVERPAFNEPSAPVAPLSTLVPTPADVRDPAQAFAVVSSTLTTGGPWGGVHGAVPAGAAAVDPAGPFSATAPFPAHGQVSALDQFPPVQVPAPYPPNGFPEPGTPAWFGPGPYGEQPTPGRADVRALLAGATPGLLLVLVLAIVITVLAPVLLVVAFVLARRATVARLAVQRAFVIALGTLGTFAVIGLFTGPLGFGDWWSFLGSWSRLVSLGVLISTVLLVRRALLGGETPTPPAPPPPYRGPWG